MNKLVLQGLTIRTLLHTQLLFAYQLLFCVNKFCQLGFASSIYIFTANELETIYWYIQIENTLDRFFFLDIWL